jgi:chitodextrinase
MKKQLLTPTKSHSFNFKCKGLLLIGITFFLSSFSTLLFAQSFECETFTGTSGCVIATDKLGFSGTGFVDMGANGTWFELNNVTVTTAGTYELIVTYGNGGSTNRPCELTINGIVASTGNFAPTGTWDTWGTIVFPAIVLNAGSNTLRVTANTTAGGPNVDKLQFTQVVPDTEKPSIPINLAATNLKQSSFTLTWTASTDNKGVSLYEVFANGVSKGTTAITTMDLKNLTPETLYKMTVTAKDASGNVSDASAPLAVTTTLGDLQNPTPPTALIASGIGTNAFLLSWTASTDNVGIDHYEIFANSISKGTSIVPNRIIVGLLPNTSYSITIKAFDAVGNFSTISDAINVSTLVQELTNDETKNYMGIGLSSQADWEPVFLYANCVVNSRDEYLGTGFLTTVDDWPANDNCDLIVGENISNQHGRYRIIFKGNIGTITLSNGTEVTGSRTYDPVRNETSYYVDVTNSGKMNLTARVRNTGGVGMRNFKIYRPIYPGANESHDTTEVFHRETLKILSKFNFLRAMDFTSTNGNNQVVWAERNIIGQRAQRKIVNTKKINGGAWEYLALLANQTKKDLWICVPAKVNDDYITKLAQLFKFGSDGVNPYTSPQANPKYPPLDPSLKLMVEYSNEIWNTAGPFSQTAYADSVGKALGLPGQNEYYVKRTVEISTIFRQVFGDSEMMTRVRPLLEWMKAGLDMYGNGNNTGSTRLFWYEKNYTQPLDYYVWGGGCSAYFNPCAGATIDNVWGGCGMDPIAWTYESQEYAAYFTSAYGLRRVVYEGGPSFGDVLGGAGMEVVSPAAMLDDRIGLEIIEHQNEWYKAGGNAFSYFCLGGDERWGFCQHPTVTNKKYDGIVQLYNQPRPAITTGFTVTTTTLTVIPGNQWRLCNKSAIDFMNTSRSNTAAALSTLNTWISYHFNVNKTAKYRVRINYSASGSGVFAIYSGSTLIASPVFTSKVKTTEWFTFDATPSMLQAIRLKITSGSTAIISSVEIAEDVNSGVAEITKSSSSQVYPTFLSNGQDLVVENSDISTPVQVSIYTQTGVLVYKAGKVTGNQKISSASLPKGLLLCVVKSASETYTVKISNL